MKLVSEDLVEFRRVTSSTGQNGSTNYYYHFEDDSNGSFQLWSKKQFTGINKGDNVRITINTRLWDNKLQYNLDNIEVV